MLENRSDHDDASLDKVIQRLDEVTSALDALSDVLEQEEELSVVLQRVCQQTSTAIPGADLASVSLLRDGRQYTAAAVDDVSKEVDEAQYRADEGPCLDAARTGQMIRADAHDVRRNWPRFAELIEHTEVNSFLSAPLFIDSEYQGSLNLYSLQSNGFHDLDAALLELYTTAAEAALRAAHRYVQARDNADQLRTALTSRAAIDQAKGIIMGARRISADEAFTLLVDQSQRENVKLRTVAEQLITRISQSDS
jgi:transcriptional regulator with GAF, ATPase, and Fis domain